MLIIRNRGTYKGFLNGLMIFVYEIYNSAGTTKTFTVETKAAAVLLALAKIKDSTTMVATTEIESTTYPGKRKVTISIPTVTTHQLLIICSEGYDDTQTIEGNTTVDDQDVY
jgi:hypothetical protein